MPHKISEGQKKIRAWFRRRKWKTDTPNCGHGVFLSMPIQQGTSYFDGERGKTFKYEYSIDIETTPYWEEEVYFTIYKRKAYKDGEKERWPRYSVASFSVGIKELSKMAELVNLCVAEANDMKREIKKMKKIKKE